jgi:hypothetical protein
VCDGSLAGDLVSPLLGEHGSAYAEEVQGFEKGGTTGFCSARGGGVALRISYHRWSGDSYKDETVEKLISTDGRQALKVGTAKGYTSASAGALFVPCPRNDDPDSKVQIQVEYLHHDGTKETEAKAFRDLTLATARYVAQDLLQCDGAESLRESTP